MVNISKLTLPDNQTYILRDSRLDNYAICMSSPRSSEKEVTIENDSFTLEVGAWVIVKFSSANLAENPTLSVNGSEAKPIYYKGSIIEPYYLRTNGTYNFIYSGSHWDFIGDIDSTEKNIQGYISKDYFPLTGQTEKIYIDKITNYAYYWTDNKYIQLKSSFEDLKITNEQIVSVSSDKIIGSISLSKLSERVYTKENVDSLINEIHQENNIISDKVEDIKEQIESGDFKGQPGENAINVVIDSSAGNIFKNGVISTILTCTVYSGSEDITDHVTQFKWIKYDKDGNLDPDWNRTLAGNTITISSQDVWSKAKFTCEVTFNK